MPGKRLVNGLNHRLSGSLLLTEATSEACRHLLALKRHLYLLTILRYDGLLPLEILHAKVLTQIAVGKDRITTIGLVDRL